MATEEIDREPLVNEEESEAIEPAREYK